MKISVLNYSGSVGKTTAAAHLFSPRMSDCDFFAIESTNESARDLGLSVEQLRGERFGDVFRKLLLSDNAIVDVGASNIEDFFAHMIQYEDSHLEFDHFVLPVISDGKAQRETIRTITALISIGVDPSRIRILFNRVGNDVESEFAAIFGYAAQGTCIANPEARIQNSGVFELLSNRRTTIDAVLADTTDYRQLMRDNRAGDPEMLHQYTELFSLQSMCRPVKRQLDRAFSALFS